MTFKRSRLVPNVTLALFACTAPAPALAGQPMENRRAQEELLTACIRRAADGRPWLEKTLWGLRDQEGGWIGARVANRDGSHDLGPLQVNSWWVPKLAKLIGRPADHVRWWLTYDACFNVEVARWIFLSGLAVTRDYWKAVGLYHSPTMWRQRRYAVSVSAHLKRRFGSQVFAASEVANDAAK